jgi:hypothetical protein
LNCSASGKKRGGDYHVVKAIMPMGFYGLIPPLVLSIPIAFLLLNLLNCKHRMGFAKIRADVSRVSTFGNSVGLHIQLDVINLAMCKSSSFNYKLGFS